MQIMSEIGSQSERKGERTIKWLSEKIGMLEARALHSESEEDIASWKALKQAAIANITKLLAMSRVETVKLIEDRFEGQH